MVEKLRNIRPKLEKLARLDPEYRLFGAATHRYQLAPPLAPDAVATFELLHGVRLPEDYRAFLLEVGSGGAGPYYGLNALGNFEHAIGRLAGLEVEPENWRTGEGLDPAFLASPFPHQTAFNPVDGSAYQDLTEDEEEALAEAEGEELFPELWEDKWLLGTLCLSEQGCNLRDLLVVSGDERGHIWTDDRCDGGGFQPIEPNRTRRAMPDSDYTPMFMTAETAHTSFLTWYEWWLDQSLNEVESGI